MFSHDIGFHRARSSLRSFRKAHPGFFFSGPESPDRFRRSDSRPLRGFTPLPWALEPLRPPACCCMSFHASAMCGGRSENLARYSPLLFLRRRCTFRGRVAVPPQPCGFRRGRDSVGAPYVRYRCDRDADPGVSRRAHRTCDRASAAHYASVSRCHGAAGSLRR